MKGYKHLTQEQRAEILSVYAETKSTRLTAERLGWNLQRVASTLKTAGVELSNWRGGACDRNRQLVTEMIADGSTLVEIARRVGTTHHRVRDWLDREGIPYQRKSSKGSNNPHWKGGKTVDKSGYVLVLNRDHPDADSHGRVREHRLVMEQVLGRRLLPTEVVHHKDDNRSNNDPGNLELFDSNADHLCETRAGQIPNWTEDGLARMRSGIARSANGKRKSNRPALTPDDVALPGKRRRPSS